MNIFKQKLREKLNFTNILIFLVLVISFLCVLKININTHIYHDEWVFSIIYGTENKIHSLKDILVSAKNIYFTHSGRVIVHTLLMILLRFGNMARAIINSTFFALLVFELIKFSGKGKLRIPIAILVFPLLWFKIPAFGQTVIWLAGATGYLWTAVTLLFYIHLLEKILKNEIEYRKTSLILFTIFSFIVGSLHEIVGVISTVILGLSFVLLLYKNKKINKTLLLGGLFNLLGFLSNILSPGTNGRKMLAMQVDGDIPSFLSRLKNSLVMLKGTIVENVFIFGIILITITFVIIKIIQKRKNKQNFKYTKEIYMILFLIVASICSYIAMSVSPTFDLRVTFVPYIIFVYVALKCLYILGVNKDIKIIEAITITFIAVLFIFDAVPDIKETFNFVKSQKIAWDKRDASIEEQIKNGKKDIYVEPLSISGSNPHLYFADISSSLSGIHNTSMKLFYEVNSIRIKENYYMDLRIKNINEDNKNSIKISSKSYEEIQNFNIITKETYDKTAPYKRYTYAYQGGEITIYPSMASIEDLCITFTKNQTITIEKLKLYTPENSIFEAKGKEILNHCKLENLEIESSTEDEIVLKVNELSKIKVLKN